MTAVARRDTRTLFERAWTHGVRTGEIDGARREALVAEGTRAIRRIAGVLGSESLRDDLERAMRSMLGLVNLHLQRVSRGDVAAAARSLADNGLLFHTKGASQAIKRVLAIEHGLDPDAVDPVNRRRFEEAVVAEWAHLPFEVLLERQREAELASRRRAAADALAATLEGTPPEPYYEPEQVILTALLIHAYAPEKAWIDGVRGFEALLEAVRRTPARLRVLPPGVPPEHRETIEDVWSSEGPRVIDAIVESDEPVHRLVAGDPITNPLHAWLVLPADALDDVDDVGELTTSHWQALTGGATDEPRLLATMLQGVIGFEAAWPLTPKAAETLLRKTLAERPEERRVAAWLDANAPHQYHADLVGLWRDFWDERESALGGESAADVHQRFAAEWLPVKAVAAKAKAVADQSLAEAQGDGLMRALKALMAKPAAAKAPAAKAPAAKPRASKPPAAKPPATRAPATKSSPKKSPAKKPRPAK
ncbi:MAG: hypothetical protein ACK54X_19145 [Burkholderiales bacterium]